MTQRILLSLVALLTLATTAMSQLKVRPDGSVNLTVSKLEKPDNSFTSRQIEVTPISSIEIEEGESMILNGAEVSIRGEFSVQKGGYFVVNIEK